jgi:folate-binding protein YgfZ
MEEICAPPAENSPMIESDLAAPSTATPLANLLDSLALPHQLAAWRGVLTPQQLDAPEAETAALTSSAAVHDLGWLKRVAVRGEDRFRWLSGMVTNMVNDLPPNGVSWNLVLNAQGRILGDLHVIREGDSLELEIAADQYEKLVTHLEHFIIMDDVELATIEAETALGLTGPLAAEVLGRLGLPALSEPMTCARVEWNGVDVRIVRGYGPLASHYELWVPSAARVLAKEWNSVRTAGAVPVGIATLDAFRIAEGIPAYGIDVAERDLPQETSQMRALHFSKGCYLGQEIVERIRSRGSVHRHLRQLELTGPLPASGTELTLDGSSAGSITSSALLHLSGGVRAFALGMIGGAAEIRNLPLTYTADGATGTARLLAGPPNLTETEPERMEHKKS